MTQARLIERAFELARSGTYSTATGVKMALRREGFSGLEPTFVGAGFRTELRAMITRLERTGKRQAQA